jgi:serine O-acetyltransferase
MNAFEMPHSPDQELPRGDTNANPEGKGLVELVLEDFRTHDKSLLEPGFWAVAVHRFGNWRMDIKPKVARAPFSVAYKVASTAINWLWGIDLGYTVRLGRRVRIWHHGGVVLSARSIGNDVHIRHNTTMGIARRSELTKRPTIGDRVDIGVGASILGDVVVGHDSIIGANAVVVTSVPPHSRVAGVPARTIAKTGAAANGSAANGSRHPRAYDGS